MILTGKIKGVQRDWMSNKWNITFEINEQPQDELNKLSLCELLSIEVKKFRKKRSLDANAMLWACLSELAVAMHSDKWSVYLLMLKRYGKYTYICVRPHVVEAVKAQWRECEEIGVVDINGEETVQMLCYFGSSTYNTKEFSRLLEGVISEMKEVGLQPPPTKEMQRALEQWEKHFGQHSQKT